MCKMKCNLSEMDLKIIAVSNRKLCERPFLEQIERVCQMKPQAIILREKDLSEEEYRILSEEVLSVCKKYEIPCILHKFWKTALELECTSVHLPLPILQKITDEEKISEIAPQSAVCGYYNKKIESTGGRTCLSIRMK